MAGPGLRNRLQHLELAALQPQLASTLLSAVCNSVGAGPPVVVVVL